MIHQINSKNAADVILKYNNNPENKDESLLNTIMSEYGGDGDGKVRKELVMHIYDALAKQTNADPAHRAKFEAEFDARFAETGFVNTKRMDEMLLRMIATPEIIAQQIEEEVDSKSGAVKGAGSPFYDELIAKIDKNNVAQVMEAYKALGTGETLIDALASEIGSDAKTERQVAIQHVFDAYADSLGTPEKVRELFTEELTAEANAFFPMSTSKLDKYMDYLSATPETIVTSMEEMIDDDFTAGAVDEREFQVLLNLVTKDNIVETFLAYDNLEDTDESLIEAITSEWTDDKNIRKEAVMHLYDALSKKFNVSSEVREEFETELNKQFDKTFGMVNTEKLDDMIDQIVGGATTAGAFVHDLSRFEHTAEQGARKLTLGNGKVWTAGALKQSAIDGAKKDPGFAKVENPFIPRPLPYINEDGKIEPTVEVLHPVKVKGKNGKPIERTLEGKVVLLNPGHGGYNPHNGFFDAGTVLSVKNAEGKDMPIEEWRVSDTYTRELAAKLQAKGATVLIVAGPVTGKGAMADAKYLESFMKGEKGPKEIRNLIKNTNRANMAFMSIHVESVKARPGDKACTVRANNDDGDLALANKVQAHVAANIASLAPSPCQNDYYVTRVMGDDIPAVLVELGNIANDVVSKSLLSSGDRDKYTDALALSLEETLLKK